MQFKKYVLFSIFCLVGAFNQTTYAAQDLCSKAEIGTRVQLGLLASNNQVVNKLFIVKSCENSIYTAEEVTPFKKVTIMKYRAGQGDNRRIQFFGQTSDNDFQATVTGNWNVKKQTIAFDSPEQCSPGEHWDSGMQMCMPDEPGDNPHNCPAGTHWDENIEECVADNPTQCKKGQYWDKDMNMCMPNRQTMFHYNQFVVYTDGSGPRGRSAVTAPNMWMLSVNQRTSEKNHVELSWMGTTDLWTVPSNGTPQMLQAGESNKQGEPFIDAQHPHSSPIMGLTLSDIMSIGKDGKHKLTFFFAPRGEATAGPEAFMHRASAEGNPDAPLSHHLQDVFHITSTVIGAKLALGSGTTFEASAFSGQEPSPSEVNLDMHKPDSYGVRVGQKINDHVSVGGSYAQVLSAHRGGEEAGQKEHEQAISGWVTTSNMIKEGTLSTSFIFGQVRNRDDQVTLNSFLEELVYQLGKNKFFGRVEVLQRTPEQLEIKVTDGATRTQWVKATTLGYERTVLTRGGLNIFAGASATKSYLPADFQGAYGGNPKSGRVFLRINWGRGHHH